MISSQHWQFRSTADAISHIGVVYASTSGPQELNTLATNRLLQSVGESPSPDILWSLRYQQHNSLDLVFDESVLDLVKAQWRDIVGENGGDFLAFEDRNPVGDDEDEEYL
jgi:hypothetical protein